MWIALTLQLKCLVRLPSDLPLFIVRLPILELVCKEVQRELGWGSLSLEPWLASRSRLLSSLRHQGNNMYCLQSYANLTYLGITWVAAKGGWYTAIVAHEIERRVARSNTPGHDFDYLCDIERV